jgi:hypothetical protein
VFYRYETRDGRVLLVDNLDKLPATVRDKAKRIEFEGNSKSILDGTLENLFSETSSSTATESTTTAHPAAGLGSIHVPSLTLGAAAGVGATLLLGWLLNSRSSSFGKRLLMSVIMTGAFVAVLSSLYLGWLRRSAGRDAGMMATPRELIDDAKRTMQQVEERRQQQQQQLDELERVAK